MVSTPLHNGSSDDILLNQTPTKLVDKVQRPRSASPVKRYSLPASFVDKSLPSLPIPVTSSSDIASLKSSASSFDMSNEKWRELTRSPAARKLHIADVGGSPKYTIPIPFTLQLPPKLSAKNIDQESPKPTSPEAKRTSNTPTKIKQTKLVYTGNGYEKLDCSDSESETVKYPLSPTPKSRNKTLQPLPRRPAPPPVAFNKPAKSPKQVQRIMDADELSIIEERHSEASTRQSSLKEKNVKSLSIKPIKIDFKPVQETSSETETERLELFPTETSYGVASIDQTIRLDSTAKYSPANSNIDNNQKTRKIEFKQIGEPSMKTRKLEFKSIGNIELTQEPSAKPTTKVLDFKYIGESEPQKSALSPEYSGEFYSSNFDNDSGFTQPLQLNHTADSTTPKENKLSPLFANFNYLNQKLKSFTSPEQNRDIKPVPINTAYNKDYSLQIPDRIFSDESRKSVLPIDNNSTKGPLVVAEMESSNRHLDNGETNIEINGGLQLQPAQRATSSSTVATNASEGTSCSWDSLQKSIDLTLGTQNDTATITPSTDQESADKTLNALSENESGCEDDVSGSIIESNDQMLPLSINKKSSDNDADVSTEERYFEDSVIAAYCVNDNDSSYFSERVEQILEEEEQDCDDVQIPCQTEEEETEQINEQSDLLDKVAQLNYNCDVAETRNLDMQEEVIIRQDAVSHLDTSSVRKTIIDNFEDENSGVGKSFYFPNNSSNITNSHEIKSRSFGSTKSKISGISYFSNNGQIEIPDLTDSVAGSYTTKASSVSHNGTTFDDIGSVSSVSTAVELEPIGIPSKGARNVLRQHIHELNDSSSESNDELETANTPIAEIRSKSSPNLQLERTELPAIPSPIRSPVRHARHKSMHSIDFDMSSLLKHKELPALPAKHRKHYETKEMENIVVAPPPIQVNYAIDFVEANKDLETNACDRGILVNKTDEVMDSLSRQMQKASMKRHSIRNTGQPNKVNLSETSRSSYQSRGSLRRDPTTSVSDQDDTDSVVIDLTKEKYDITTIHRNNSTHSYKSIIEKTKDGKEVEVVLLEDNDEDLLSIYSKYRKMQLFRSGSVQSSVASENSAYLYNSITSSKQLTLKPITSAKLIDRNTSNLGGKVSDRRYRNSISSSSSGISSNYDYRRIQPPAMKDSYTPKASPQKGHRKRHTVDFDTNYFDYSSKDTYDFNSFKKQINSIPTTTL